LRLPPSGDVPRAPVRCAALDRTRRPARRRNDRLRSEEHTSELQSLTNLVCRLLLEKKKKKNNKTYTKTKKKKLYIAKHKKHHRVYRQYHEPQQRIIRVSSLEARTRDRMYY